jgi:hypothetical protein
LLGRFIMVSFTFFSLLTALAATVTASPLEMYKRGIQPGQGTHDGYFYSFWTDNQGSVDYNNGPRGSYNVRWNNVNNWVGGKGWKPGPPRRVAYNGTWNNYNVNSCMSNPPPLPLTQAHQPQLTTAARPRPVRLDHQPARRVLHRRGVRHVQPVVGHQPARHHR